MNCHGNAGALNGDLLNRNFNTNVEDVVHPARVIENFPIDGGFGQAANPDGSFGNRTFNTAPVVEAADTAPFLHNNVVATLEGVVEFYAGPEFNTPRAPSARFSFSQTQRDQVADFMRGINTLQNIDVATRELKEFLTLPGTLRREQDRRLQTALDDTMDAVAVLTEGGIYPYAIARLVVARGLLQQALYSSDPAYRRVQARLAGAALAKARGLIAVP